MTLSSSSVYHFVFSTYKDSFACAVSPFYFVFYFVLQQTIRELFDMNDGERKEVAVELSVPQVEEEEAVNKQCTTILEQVSEEI